MSRKDSVGGASTPGDRRQNSIQPLPEEVVARIKSSTAIVSLAGVVLELLANSLDAGATRIEATVDFARGGCTVEDDGLGIAPFEFGEDGGLGKLYCTSKYLSHDPSLGCNGTFLASLAAVSLLTITSHHHEHRSHNLVTFHNSKAVERQRPALSRNQIKYEKHGTRVTVRNLFGNLPVRVKQRAAIEEQKNEKDRLWDALKRDISSLLLSWRHPVSLKVRDADHKTLFNFSRDPSSTVPTPRPRSAELPFILSTLSQAGYINVDEWPSWVPVSASTADVSIKGAIALDPAPTKRCQFISLGIRPLLASSGHNELYDDINRVFSLSDFGTMDEDADLDETEKIRRQGDRRFTSDGYSNRQLKGRKGVDRHPMFFLRISLKNDVQCHRPEERLFENGSNLQAVITMLNAMLAQWLSVHHFRPRKARTKKQDLDTTSTPTRDCDAQAATSSPLQVAFSKMNRGLNTAGVPSPAKSENRKRKRLSKASPVVSDPNMRTRPFTEWSRIKSGKADFLDNIKLSKQVVHHSVEDYLSKTRGAQGTSSDTPTLDALHPKADASDAHMGTSNTFAEISSDVPSVDAYNPNFQTNTTDAIMEWQDPASKQMFLLNARTGCAMPRAPSRSHTDRVTATHATTLREFNKSLRLPKRPVSEPKDTPWLNGVLKDWDNPIFKTSEQHIQQVSLDDSCGDRSHHHCSRIEVDKAFTGSSLSGTSKLSKEGLRHARVIAQLDRKFILAKIPNATDVKSSGESDALVIIDQHAADERIRVETLFEDLCAPPITANRNCRSKLGHSSQIGFIVLEKPAQFAISSQEELLFTTHATRFAAWGILYHTDPPKPSTAGHTTRGKPQSMLSITTLPPSISERCKADPKLLINFLRSTVWKYSEETAPASLGPSTSTNDAESPAWLRQLATCPPGLVDLINSRACRSAIMFNDELSMLECEELVSKLAKCVFPFMCAHGRPSMVPLVDLGVRGGGDGERLGLFEGKGKGKGGGIGFVDAWKRWKCP